MATPFVQGRLRDERIAIEIETEGCEFTLSGAANRLRTSSGQKAQSRLSSSHRSIGPSSRNQTSSTPTEQTPSSSGQKSTHVSIERRGQV